MRILSITVSPEMAGRSVSSLLRRELNMDKGYIVRLKYKKGAVKLDGEDVRTVDKVKAGQILEVDISDRDTVSGIEATEYPLVVPYEDLDCAVIDKPSGMAVHGLNPKLGTPLISAFAHRWGKDAAFHPVSRLDKGTSGLMCIALNGYVHSLFIRALHSEDYRREYLLVCSPPPVEKKGSISLPIARESEDSPKRRVSDDGAPALTEYEVLAEEKGLALVKARLHTGRTHQIRVHFAAIGSPLLGDAFYGGSCQVIDRPALHSAFLSMVQPVTKKRIVLRSPLPEDMAALAPSFAKLAEEAFHEGELI